MYTGLGHQCPTRLDSPELSPPVAVSILFSPEQLWHFFPGLPSFYFPSNWPLTRCPDAKNRSPEPCGRIRWRWDDQDHMEEDSRGGQLHNITFGHLLIISYSSSYRTLSLISSILTWDWSTETRYEYYTMPYINLIPSPDQWSSNGRRGQCHYQAQGGHQMCDYNSRWSPRERVQFEADVEKPQWHCTSFPTTPNFKPDSRGSVRV